MKYIIHALAQADFPVDRNQVQGVLNELQLFPPPVLFDKTDEVVIIQTSEENIDKIEPEPMTRHLLLVSGAHGLKKAEQLKSQNKDLLVVCSVHQYVDELENLTHYPDILALPKGVLSDTQREFIESKTKLVETFGVAHTVNQEAILEASEAFDLSSLKGKKIVSIMLAGDAPDESGQQRFFTPAHAREQAKHIHRIAKEKMELDQNTKFLVTNGPRTGKHDYVEGALLDPNPHQAEVIDEVTMAFIQELGLLLNGSKATLLPFSFTVDEPSFYLPMLGAACDAKGLYFVPSDSLSRMTESTYAALQGAEVIAYRPASENKVHAAHMMQMYGLGFLSVLSQEGDLLERKAVENETTVSMIAASEQIALSALARMNTFWPVDMSKAQPDAVVGTKALLSEAELEKLLNPSQRRDEMANDNAAIEHNPAGSTDEQAAGTDSLLTRAYKALPNTPESVKPYLTKQNGMIAGATLLATGLGFFALSRAGVSVNPLNVFTPKGPK